MLYGSSSDNLLYPKKCWAEVFAQAVLGICELSPKWRVGKWTIPNCYLTCRSQFYNSWSLPFSCSWRVMSNCRCPNMTKPSGPPTFQRSKVLQISIVFHHVVWALQFLQAWKSHNLIHFIIFLGGKWEKSPVNISSSFLHALRYT